VPDEEQEQKSAMRRHEFLKFHAAALAGGIELIKAARIELERWRI
jgi:hypothetical protein